MDITRTELGKEVQTAKKCLDEIDEKDIYDHRDIGLSPGYYTSNKYFPGKDISGEFLTEKEVLTLRKDTCVFCNTKLKTIETSSTKTDTHFDDGHGGSGQMEYSDSLVIKYVVAEDAYYFNIDFSGKLTRSILTHRNRLEEELTQQKNKELLKLKRKWSSLPLPEKQKKVAMNSLLQNWRNKNLGESHFGTRDKLSNLVDNAIYHLYLGDLNYVCTKDSQAVQPEEKHLGSFDWYKFQFFPRGLKSHQDCWPFEIPAKDTRIKTTYGEFLTSLKRNPLFAEYDSKFPQFKDARDYVSRQTLEIIANSYTIADGVKML